MTYETKKDETSPRLERLNRFLEKTFGTVFYTPKY